MVFLSHAGEDSAAARSLAEDLRKAGIDVWLDTEQLQPGDRWVEKLEHALRESSAFLLYVGRSGVQRWVDLEIRTALDRGAADPSFLILPVLGEGSDVESLSLFVRSYQWHDMRAVTDRKENLDALVAAIHRRDKRSSSLLPADQAPFRGLLAFGTNDSLLYFGRDAETQALLVQLRKNRFQLVVGDSGCGKSSLVLAGLIPALYRGRFYNEDGWVEDWRVAVLRPGSDPFEELSEALLDLAPEKPSEERAQFYDYSSVRLRKDTGGLRSCIAGLVPRNVGTLLVVDQFEELFTLCPDEATRRRFIDCLLAASEPITTRAVHVLIALRADFYARCWEHDGLRARVAESQYAVGRLNRRQLVEVIERPLRLAAASAEPGLVDEMVSDAGDEPGNLPLLEHVLLQLWKRRSGNVLTHSAYKALGKLAGTLRNHADSTMEKLESEDSRQLARRIFLSLTHPGEGTEDTRRRVLRSELDLLTEDRTMLDKVLKILDHERLIILSAGVGPGKDKQETWVEIAHEALIREWPQLREWLDESRDILRLHRRIQQGAEEWNSDELRRDSGALLRGVRLVEAEGLARTQEIPLSPLAKEFLTASIAARDAEQAEEERRRTAELELARKLQEAAEYRAETERQAKISADEKRAEAEKAKGKWQLRFGAAMVSAVASFLALFNVWNEAKNTASADPTPMGRIQSALSKSTLYFRDARFSGDGKRFAIGGDDGHVHLVSLDNGSEQFALALRSGPFEGLPIVRLVDYSRTGNFVAAAQRLGGWQVWDANTGREVSSSQKSVEFLRFSSDGRLLATSGEEGVCLRDIPNPENIWCDAEAPQELGSRPADGAKPEGTWLHWALGSILR